VSENEQKKGDNQALRILICSTGVPHPTDGASIVLFFHYVQQILRAGHTVLHLLLLEADHWDQQDVSDYTRTIKAAGDIEVVTERATRFAWPSFFKIRFSLDQGSAFYATARAFRPDAIVAFDIIPAGIVADVEARRRVIWLGDLQFLTMRLHASYGLRENPFDMIPFAKVWLASKSWRRAYIQNLRRADSVIVSSGSSVDELRLLGLSSSYEPYPWPSDGRPLDPAKKAEIPSFLFFGSLAGLGSRSALHFMTEEVYPKLVATWGTGGFRILVAGRGELAEWFKDAIANKPEFEWLGFVEDLDPLLEKSHAVIAPIVVPVGNRSRILTALAKGALVIAHQNVALGNPDLVNGKTCVLAKTVDEFVGAMQASVTDKAWARGIADGGRNCYETIFRPERSGPRLASYLLDPKG
jgi:glycosyltransferase involved in cell wall biosynthesis